jgi:hemolysin activation/secretion protein
MKTITLLTFFGLLASARVFAASPEAGPLPQLRAIVLITREGESALPASDVAPGIDISRCGFVSPEMAERALRSFLGQPIAPSLTVTIPDALRQELRQAGQTFAVAHVPVQDVTEGVLRVVVEQARLEGDLKVEGAKYFSAETYRLALPLVAGNPIDAPQVADRVAWLNDNPFRRAGIVVEAGTEPGTTKLTLRVQEERPWRFTAGYSNTGTAVTDEDRVSASVSWGNAFGRGDLVNYTFAADPRLEHSRSHAANYTTMFRSRRSLTIYGSHSAIESVLPVPLTQEGKSWQTGLRFGVPLKPLGQGSTQTLAFTADFKASDNNLEFAAIPITDNLTHVVQFGATYGLNFAALGGRNTLSLAGYVSPGGLSDRNRGRYFGVSRFGAKAKYAYAKVSFSHQRAFGDTGFWWSTTAEAQAASGALLGTEQLNGGGVYAVRGYGESTAFGDEGVTVNNELHAPAFSPFKTRDRADAFAFVDAAALHNRGIESDSIELASAGVGLNYQVRRHFTLRAAYGWQLKELANIAGKNSHGHIAVSVAY